MHVQVNGVRLFFDVEGAGLVPDGPTLRRKPVLLLLHGGPGYDHSVFKPMFSVFADICQVVYLDHRGQGRSEAGPEDRWTLAQWGDDVRAFCDTLGIEKPIVLGQSFGGYVAQSYATRHPDHPGKLILSSTIARKVPERVSAKFRKLGGPEAQRIADAFWDDPNPETQAAYERVCYPLYNTRHDMFTGDGAARVVRRPEVLLHFRKRPDGEIHRMNFLPDLPKVRCPTLVMAGEEDPVTPADDAAEMAAAIPQHLVRFQRFPGCGHGVFRDAPEEGLTAIRRFILS